MDDSDVQDRDTADRLRAFREKIRAETTDTLLDLLRERQDEDYLYGDRDLRLFPQLRQHLDEVAALYPIQEQPFRSHIPVLGRLISWFRERWNRISTKWYVLPMVEQQSRFNLAVVRVLQDLHHLVQASSLDMVQRMDAFFRTNQQEYAALAARQGDLQATALGAIQALGQVVADRESELRSALWQNLARQEERLQEVAHEQQVDHQGLAFQRMKLDRLMGMVAAPGGSAAEEKARLEVEREGLLDHEYYRFEDTYRHEEEVRENQRIYLPYFEDRQEILDIGCGKGEFLELLRDSGISAYGVDLNEQMVRICQEKGLRAVFEDGLKHLATRPDGSLGGIFAAHLVEHLPLHTLTELVQQAQAKLQPGAYLIFETPNPLCLWALVNYFYLDMSHVKPLHPQALSFLLEYCGFHDIEIRYLHPVPEGVRMVLLPEVNGTPWQEMNHLLNANLERLNALLYGFADYAITARR